MQDFALYPDLPEAVAVWSDNPRQATGAFLLKIRGMEFQCCLLLAVHFVCS